MGVKQVITKPIRLACHKYGEAIAEAFACTDRTYYADSWP